jgi:hypothetical protein
MDPDDYPVEIHDGTDDGHDNYAVHETLIVLASFYGPNSMSFAKLMRDGLYIAQNREQLTTQGMTVTDVGKPVAAAEIVNQQWIRRYDVAVRFRRKVERSYPILNILSAPFEIGTDSHD